MVNIYWDKTVCNTIPTHCIAQRLCSTTVDSAVSVDNQSNLEDFGWGDGAGLGREGMGGGGTGEGEGGVGRAGEDSVANEGSTDDEVNAPS
mmetsp:Transcript_19427/g.35071  ORF Transcript_19427/g.35071 Transcript_19427/m.35071 type:complete len:91 (-) Transcript_19427:179-451(-)|eukprot:CAMPEP_0175048012 /NCGR_PEP_ID=MMETSP0052_2-20121109/5929_1 /TAXON_ID=51329 ORGANISM="Polytomella parva, Strain SAG 63-3" /NCGR_SAMPLE_ID=MMETSP0052_2 /ASSEMBLY_ACC=CAM_ASM_000194 /LENGTH=90 /DNA_ID=CAMNT_0016311981 /DNA_START=114 /DNA_END=386 /DNA_ORIENTATION=+